jgi:predicted ferric reductase
MWWSIRALGLVAMASLWLGLLFGVLLAGRGGLVEAPIALLLHQHPTLAAAVATALHVLLAVADETTDIPAIAALIPATSPTLTGPLALGAVAAWAIGAVLVTTALRPRLSATAWRAVHATAFGGFLVALAHGWTAGTDTPAVGLLYAVAGASVLGAVVLRAAWPQGKVSTVALGIALGKLRRATLDGPG